VQITSLGNRLYYFTEAPTTVTVLEKFGCGIVDPDYAVALGGSRQKEVPVRADVDVFCQLWPEVSIQVSPHRSR